MASDNSPEAQRARAEARLFKAEGRQAQVSERERDEAARVSAIDEKTARLKALRLARDAAEASAKKAAK